MPAERDAGRPRGRPSRSARVVPRAVLDDQLARARAGAPRRAAATLQPSRAKTPPVPRRSQDLASARLPEHGSILQAVIATLNAVRSRSIGRPTAAGDRYPHRSTAHRDERADEGLRHRRDRLRRRARRRPAGRERGRRRCGSPCATARRLAALAGRRRRGRWTPTCSTGARCGGRSTAATSCSTPPAWWPRGPRSEVWRVNAVAPRIAVEMRGRGGRRRGSCSPRAWRRSGRRRAAAPPTERNPYPAGGHGPALHGLEARGRARRARRRRAAGRRGRVGLPRLRARARRSTAPCPARRRRGSSANYLRGRLPAIVDAYTNIVDVEDVADGHLLAAERGQAGRALHPRRREPALVRGDRADREALRAPRTR